LGPGNAIRTSTRSGRRGLARGQFGIVATTSVASVALLLSGCTGTRAGSVPRTRTVTVASYAGFPATTIVGSYSAAACRDDARSYVRSALQFVAHSGPAAAYSADNYYLLLRQVFADFQARSCPNAILGEALRQRMSAGQRSSLIADLPAVMAGPVRQALEKSG
jgi:hypothetical protein